MFSVTKTYKKTYSVMFSVPKSESERRQAIMQCIRTTLVKYPDDIRGRRRARVAQDILIYHIYEEKDISYKIKSRFKAMANRAWDGVGSFLSACLPKCLHLKRTKQRFLFALDCFLYTLSSLRILCVSTLDCVSDISIIYAVYQSLNKIHNLFNFFTEEYIDKESDEVDVLPMAQALRSGWGKSKTKLRAVILLKNITNANANLTRELVNACNVTEEDYEKFGEDLEMLQNIFSKYLKNLFFVFSLTILKQSGRAVLLAYINSTIVYGSSGMIMAVLLFSFNFLLSPFLHFWEMIKVSVCLHDPEKEVLTHALCYNKDISLARNRYVFSITEAFAESLSSCRTQLGFYFAFSYIVGTQPEYKTVDCIANTLLAENRGIFTFYAKGWHGMPKLVFSAMMSLFAISQAQYNVYKTRHEFDMTLSGKLVYFFSAMLAAFVKIAASVMFYTVSLIFVIDPKSSDSQILVSVLPTIFIYYFQTKIVSLVDWWTTAEGESGYSLFPNTGFIWPSTSNLELERSRLKRMRLRDLGIPKKTDGKAKIAKRMFTKYVFAKSSLWHVDIIIPFMGFCTNFRLGRHPNYYGFGKESRERFQRRFGLTLGNISSYKLF